MQKSHQNHVHHQHTRGHGHLYCELDTPTLRSTTRSISQSINQSSFYRANIPDEVMLSGATAKSVLNKKIEETVP